MPPINICSATPASLASRRLSTRKTLAAACASSTKKSLTGTHLTYRQFYNNLPVFNEQLKVSVNKNLQVTQVSSDVEPVGAGSKGGFDTRVGGSEADAIKAAIAAVKAHGRAKQSAKSRSRNYHEQRYGCGDRLPRYVQHKKSGCGVGGFCRCENNGSNIG
ncbi:MAG: hypothetical protein WKF71_01245 [Pyrinomonadaceae bacterium]